MLYIFLARVFIKLFMSKNHYFRRYFNLKFIKYNERQNKFHKH